MQQIKPQNRPDSWKLAEFARSHRNMKAVGEQMLWGLLLGVPVKLQNPLDHFSLSFERITEVRYQLPPSYKESSVVVCVVDSQKNRVTARGEHIMIEPPTPQTGIWGKLNMDDNRRTELFTAMKKAYTVCHNGKEFARITGILFHRQGTDRLAASVEALDATDRTTRLIAPQEEFTVTGHLLNR